MLDRLDSVVTNLEKLFEDDAALPQSGFRLIATKPMHLSEWNSIPDCPYQRDTVRRARAASHLRVYDDSHKRVAIASLPNGKRFKVDGHTRALMWKEGRTVGLPPSLMLIVDEFKCTDTGINSLGALYRRFDSKQAAQSTSDIVHSAVRAHSIKLESPFLQKGSYASALKRLYTMLNGYSRTCTEDEATFNHVWYFEDELKLFDSTHPMSEGYVSVIVMAALLTFMKYGPAAKQFWVKYGENGGLKTDAGVDGVQALRNLLTDIRQKRHTNQQFDWDNIGKAINAFERYRNGEMYTGKTGIPNKKEVLELEKYLKAAVKQKETAG